MSKKRLEGTVHSTDVFADACVRDAVRLAIAAFESAALIDAPAADSRSCAWQFIKYYYAAYFAANGLMRLAGHACVNLTAMDCASVNSWALAHGVGGRDERNKIAPGLFQLSFNSTTTPTFALRLHSGKGGVHIQFWSGFSTYLTALRSDLQVSLAPTPDRLAAIADLDLLEAELQRGGLTHASWLSEMRNAVNYRFEHGAWFPYETQTADKTALCGSFKLLAEAPVRYVSPPPAASEMVRAGRACGFLVGWLKNSLDIISERAKGEKAQLAKGALAFAAKM